MSAPRTSSRPAEHEGRSWDRASFRDPDSRVLHAGGRILRTLSERGLADWEALSATALFRDAVAAGELVATERVEPSEPLPDDAVALLGHQPVPFVSYPYEWSFGMLQAAALLQLDLTRRAIAERLMVKDASPYNVQWRGTQPVFIDVGSFERLREGEPWIAYRQFCMLFLYPLMLSAYRGAPFQPWLRGRLEGIAPAECRRLMSARDLWRRGVLTHVVLHARLEGRQARPGGEIKSELRASGFKTDLIRANVERLHRLVARLRPRAGDSAWTGYRIADPYSEEDAARKADFVRRLARLRSWGLVWDIGSNDGRYSRIAADGAEHVVAMDADERVVDDLYRSLAAEGPPNVLPLVVDVADASPNLGWRGLERSGLVERGRPDLVLALALVHHLAITQNIGLRDLVGWLRSLGAALAIEFPTRDDPMVQELLARKREGLHADYDTETFEAWLRASFAVQHREELRGGTRILYFAEPKP